MLGLIRACLGFSRKRGTNLAKQVVIRPNKAEGGRKEKQKLEQLRLHLRFDADEALLWIHTINFST